MAKQGRPKKGVSPTPFLKGNDTLENTIREGRAINEAEQKSPGTWESVLYVM